MRSRRRRTAGRRQVVPRRQRDERADVPGDPALNLVGVYRSSATTVRQAGGVPARWRQHAERVRACLDAYRP
ncbi:hypothetical protein FHR32_000734 [Streptosporangium album]|uniref:Uncharacterized protein n=1 Tax=Streptosporangium album TaxID=47479 RepID=A0A7W7RQQ5_9ACTN|nr:hypothetical protein [Streptosporangium album]MBB4936429.1 hypothetical protein [Streptosporangium album]